MSIAIQTTEAQQQSIKANASASDTQNVLRAKNEYAVPHHKFEITLSDGNILLVDSGSKDDWSEINPLDVENSDHTDTYDWVCWGDKNSGCRQIVSVIDCETGESLDPLWWAKSHVWAYNDAYSS